MLNIRVATHLLCESHAPLLRPFQLCSNNRSTVRSRHEHRPLHLLAGGVGGAFAQFQKSVARPEGKARHCVRFLLAASTRIERPPLNQSSISLKAQKFPPRASDRPLPFLSQVRAAGIASPPVVFPAVSDRQPTKSQRGVRFEGTACLLQTAAEDVERPRGNLLFLRRPRPPFVTLPVMF